MLLGCVLALFTWRLVRRNRVSPRYPTTAPLAWLWSPRAAARLHRRLRTTIATTADFRPKRRADPELRSLIDALEDDAASIDEELVYVSRYPLAARKERLDALDIRARHLEAAAEALAIGPAPRGVWLDDGAPVSTCILERNRLLRQAHQELECLERGAPVDSGRSSSLLDSRR